MRSERLFGLTKCALEVFCCPLLISTLAAGEGRPLLLRQGDGSSSTPLPRLETQTSPVARLLFPFYQGSDDSSTGFAVTNFSPVEALLRVTAYRPGGALLIPCGRNPAEIKLAAHGQTALQGFEIFQVEAARLAGQSAWVELASDAPIGGFFQFFRSSPQMDGSAAFSDPHRKLYFTRVHQGAGTFRGHSASTRLSIANPTEAPVKVRLNLYGPSGLAAAAEQTMTIAAKGFFYRGLDTLFEVSSSTGGYVTAEVVEGEGIVGFELVQLPSAQSLFGLAASVGNPLSESFSAQLAHWPGLYFTEVKLVNVGTGTRRATLTAIDDQGGVLGVPAEVTLAPGGALERDVADLLALDRNAVSVGTLRVRADGPDVVGDVVFGTPDSLATAAALPLQHQTLTHAVFHQVANAMGYLTGLAFHNPGRRQTSVSVETYNPQGVRTGTNDAILLPAGGRMARQLTELVPASAGQVGGYIVLRSDQPLVAQELFLGDGFMSAVPPSILNLTVLSVSPQRARVGDRVDIFGTGFGAAPGTVAFGDAAAEVLAWTDTRIETAVPAGAGPGALTVTTAEGQTQAVQFELETSAGEVLLEEQTCSLDAQGGTIALGDGASLIVAPGALTSSRSVTLEKIGDEKFFGAGNHAAYDLTGLGSACGISLTFPIPAGLDAGAVGVMRYNPTTLQVEKPGFVYDTEDGKVTVSLACPPPPQQGVASPHMGQAQEDGGNGYTRWVVEWSTLRDDQFPDGEKLIPMPYYQQAGAPSWAADAMMLGKAYAPYSDRRREYEAYQYIKTVGQNLGPRLGLGDSLSALEGAIRSACGAASNAESFIVNANLKLKLVEQLNLGRPVILKASDRTMLVVGVRKISLGQREGWRYEFLVHDSKGQQPADERSGATYWIRDWTWLLNQLSAAWNEVLHLYDEPHSQRSLQTIGLPCWPDKTYKVAFKGRDDGQSGVYLGFSSDESNGYAWYDDATGRRTETISSAMDRLEYEVPLWSTDRSGRKAVQVETRILQKGDPSPTFVNVETKTVAWDEISGGRLVLELQVPLAAFLREQGGNVYLLDVALLEADSQLHLDGFVLEFVVLALTPATPSQQLVVGTFNAQFLPTFFSPKSDPDDDVKRAKRVAARILASGYDIIAFNEIFDEEARETLVNELSTTFPHYVSYLDAPTGAEDFSDSGLMLFSRFPFEPLLKSACRTSPSTLTAQSAGQPWTEVAFHEFSQCDDSDCWAAKGVGYVRARNPVTSRPLNLLFTHLQASYSDDDLADWKGKLNIRASQLGDIDNLIHCVLDSSQIQGEDVFVFGDLNVDGDLNDKDRGLSGGAANNLYEWNYHFGSGSGFFAGAPLWDAWAFETSPQDRGITNETDKARFDYILRSKYNTGDAEGLAVQHLTRALNLRDRGDPASGPAYYEGGLGNAGWCDLSDHLGVNAVLNRWASYCSPVLAATPTVSPMAYFSGEIKYPGSYQWLRFDKAGAYAFEVTGASGAKRHVYQAADLSTPLLPYDTQSTTVKDDRGNPITVKRFLLSKPPYYVRVIGATTSHTGTYSLFMKRYTGQSMDEAILLAPAASYDYTMPTTPLNANDEVWFELDLDAADSGAAQSVRFWLTYSSGGSDGLTLILFDSNGTKELSRAQGASGRAETTQNIVGPKRLYLVARRTAASYPAGLTSFKVGWETNLTILHGVQAGISNAVPISLTCDTQTDLIGDDTIYLTITVDGVKKIARQALGDFDEGESKSLDNIMGTIRFLSKVDILLEEYDSASSNDFIQMWINTLGSGDDEVRNGSTWGADAPVAGHYGVYTFRYNLSRQLR